MRRWKPLAALAALILVSAACTERELVSEDFTTSEYPDGYRNLETMELAFQAHQAYGFQYSDVVCTPHSATPESLVVSCDFLWTTVLHRIGDHSPTPAVLSVVVEDGRITRVARGTQPFQSFWNPWITFLGAEHPEFSLVVDRSLDLEPDSHRELMELLPQYLKLYEEWANSQES